MDKDFRHALRIVRAHEDPKLTETARRDIENMARLGQITKEQRLRYLGILDDSDDDPPKAA